MDMHGWVVGLLPDVPPTPVDMNEAFYVFNNTLLGTQLTCRWVDARLEGPHLTSPQCDTSSSHHRAQLVTLCLTTSMAQFHLETMVLVLLCELSHWLFPHNGD
jgi:hypothetical protein